MLVSVCIPTFNGERFIRQTIQSVLSQSHSNLEVVISDHSSSDATLGIVRSFIDPRIRIVNTPRDVGIADNWNAAVFHARGSLVKVMGQDDLLYPKAIESEVDVMRTANALVGFCYSDRDVVGARGELIRRRRSKLGHTDESGELIRRIVRSGGNPVGEPVAVLFRRMAWEQVGGFRGSYVIDLDFYSRVLTRFSAVATNSCVGAFRVHRSSWGSRQLTQQFGVIAFYLQLRSNWAPNVALHDVFIGSTKAMIRTPLRILIQQLRC